MSLEQIRENYYRLEAKYDELWERVRELEEGIRRHSKSIVFISKPYMTDSNLWALIEKQEGGWDE